MQEGVCGLKHGSSDQFSSLFNSLNPISEPQVAECCVSFIFLTVFLNAFYLSELIYLTCESFKKKIVLKSPKGVPLPGLLPKINHIQALVTLFIVGE